MDNSMILMDRVTKVYGNGQKALDNVSLRIDRGEFVFLVGNSGAGKTTLLDLILKETEPTEGSVVVNSVLLGQLKTRQVYRYRRYIGMVFQDFKLFPDFTVYDNVAFAQRLIEADPGQIRDRVREVLSSVGLDKKAGCYPQQLSGGERQRIGIARAFLHDGDMIFLDEPTSNIDSLNEGMILRSLKQECADKTILMVSHRKSTMGIADDVLDEK